jgi:hypothetical protein
MKLSRRLNVIKYSQAINHARTVTIQRFGNCLCLHVQKREDFIAFSRPESLNVHKLKQKLHIHTAGVTMPGACGLW